MKLIVNALIVVICLAVVGCSSSQYLVDKSYVIYPQNVLSEEGDELQVKSMKALLDSFADYRWEIHGIDKEKSTVIAEVCRRGEHCVEVEATVNKNGSVEIIRTPGQDLTRNEGAVLRRWLANVKKAYNKHMTSDS